MPKIWDQGVDSALLPLKAPGRSFQPLFQLLVDAGVLRHPWLSLTFLGFPWPFFAFLGVPWPSLAFFGVLWSYFAFLLFPWPSFIILGCPWPSLVIFGCPWHSWPSLAVLYFSWCSLTVLGISGLSLAILGCPWSSLAVLDLPWPFFGPPWPSLAVLGVLGLCWPSLSFLSHPWPSLAFFALCLYCFILCAHLYVAFLCVSVFIWLYNRHQSLDLGHSLTQYDLVLTKSTKTWFPNNITFWGSEQTWILAGCTYPCVGDQGACLNPSH